LTPGITAMVGRLLATVAAQTGTAGCPSYVIAATDRALSIPLRCGLSRRGLLYRIDRAIAPDGPATSAIEAMISRGGIAPASNLKARRIDLIWSAIRARQSESTDRPTRQRDQCHSMLGRPRHALSRKRSPPTSVLALIAYGQVGIENFIRTYHRRHPHV
jgi:hypothetical protein